MKKKFYSKLLITSLALMCGVVNLFSQTGVSQGPPPVVTIGAAVETAGTFTVPVNVTGFINVASLSLTVNYDQTRLVYTGVTPNPSFSGTGLFLTPTTDQSGTVKLSFTQPGAIVLADPLNTLCTISFRAQPGIGGATVPLTWSTTQAANEFAPPAPDFFSPAITPATIADYFVAGEIVLPAIQVITGPPIVCNGSTGIVYNAPSDMSDYVWAITGGGFITAGDGTDHITVTWTSVGVWSITVSYHVPGNGTVNSSPCEVIVGPTITGPQSGGLPAKLKSGNTLQQVYTTEPGMTNYAWAVSSAGSGTFTGQGTNEITVDWINVSSQQSVSVTYTGPGGCVPSQPTVLIINYYPFADAINPDVIPKYMDPLPHFAAGLRVNAKKGGALVVKAELTQQIALSKGTPVTGGTVDPINSPSIGLGNYAGYAISADGGQTFGPTMWPAQTIETQQGNGVTVEYRNELGGVHYDQFNILADQTLMMNGYTLTGDPLTEPYTGPIPMVVHLHGGEMPSGSDGGPNAWFMPTGTTGFNLFGPTYQTHQSGISTYPNTQEATTAWFHPHDDGLTRINVYTGLAGYYFIRGADEEAAKFPGWSGDDKVLEVTPTGKSPTFVGPPTPFFPTPTAYLPEVEIAIQDRMFNVDGELFWPVDPPNPEIHPFWTPEFVGNIMTVNGKTYPYLSVAPRKYRFRMLEGCNARFLNMWLEDASNGAPGPVITVIGGEGGLLAHPIDLDPAAAQTLLMAPGQRYDVIVDFSGMEGKTFTLRNDAGAPYPDGDPVDENTSQIMQFIVNGQMIEVNNISGTDNSEVPEDLRPVTPLIALTDFAGNLLNGVDPVVNRQIVLNEVSADGGPAAVLVNNSYFDAALAISGDPYAYKGGPSELLREGTTETCSIINISADAHPIHIHLLQWQLVSRRTLDVDGYMAAYQAAFNGYNPADFPAGLGYPGGAGTPLPYDQPNGDGAIGGNPAVSRFTGPVIPANPEERGWKDNIIVMPGEVTTFVVRVAPTDRAINATPQELMFPFDPSDGPGYVWHCHIVDHEDMSMMRPLMILPSPLRAPQITTQPANVTACTGDASAVSFSVSATSSSTITYQWEVSTNNGSSWSVLSGATAATLQVIPSVSLNGNLYHCILTNGQGSTTSDAASLTVANCDISGTLKYGNSTLDPLAGFTVTAGGKTATTNASGEFTIIGVTSGNHAVTVDPQGKAVGGINSTDAGLANYWFTHESPIPFVTFMSGDVDNDFSIIAADALRIQNYFVTGQPFDRAQWQFHNATGTGTTNPPAFTVPVNGASVSSFNILSLSTGDFNASFLPSAPAKGMSAATSGVKLLNEGSVRVAAGRTFDLPLRAVTDMEVGAVSLILNLSTDLVEVAGVEMLGSKNPVSFRSIDNQLRIGWHSLTPLNVKAGGDMVILKLRTSVDFTDGKIFQINMESDPLNEIATGKFKVVDGATLKAETVAGSTLPVRERTGNELWINVYPNPVKGVATMNYTIPGDGEVTIELYNSIGAIIKTLVNEPKTTGKHTMDVDFSSLPRGMYMAKIKLHGSVPDQVRTVRFIVNK